MLVGRVAVGVRAMTHEPYSHAEALGQALTRAEAAELENRQLKIELEDQIGRCARLAGEIRDLGDENRKLVKQVLDLRDAREAQAG